MPRSKNIFRRILIWRYKYVSERQFVYVLSILVGFLAGLGTLVLKNMTFFFHDILEGNLIKGFHNPLYFIFPIIGLFLVYSIKRSLLKKDIGHGISTTLYAISKRSGIIEKYKIYASLITAPITVGFGGSAGLQGPAVSTGAALGSTIAQLFHMNTKTRMLLIGCATAGAMSSMFKAPVAAIVFAVEIFSLDLAFASLVPLLLASVSAVITSYFFLGHDVLLGFKLQDVFEIKDIAFYILLGIGTGVASVYFSKTYFAINSLFDQFEKPFQKLVIGAITIGVLLYLIPSLYGEGYGVINSLLKGDAIGALKKIPYDFDFTNAWVVIVFLLIIILFKGIAMTVTFAAGGVGGIFIPTLVMGSALGSVFAKVINEFGFSISESNFTLIGMTGLMAGVLHAPLTAIFLIAEITGGYDLFVPLMLVAAISYAFTKYFVSNSIYTVELAKKGALITHNKDKNVLMMMELDQVIETNFKQVTPEMTLGELLRNAVAVSSRNIFPVLDETQQFLGIVLLDDIRPMMFDQDLYDKTNVADVMKSAPGIIFHDDAAEKVMEKFKESGAWNLPVVEKGKYIGFISKSKLLTVYRNKLIEVTV
ncbi:Voltage gated chloride channel family protein [Tenacibaculum maritimum]|uniref:chloride channel protein n=1 Tax=Tenacibaculum maritimum TaxID=107401 RepID=UPI0012E417D1|nr:chloride channel protein [Tenacibaculum maritimum]CAA0172989.1 Voltage gated chloride channel family protein [Tenacibaculum maritimum]CAA0175334.1 Voltage gated chloride channel family protein [Tenacibaculum maritimum]CAA0179793.1 Voltage gated chloride channel family protein [Tenacibaculum maritimum]